MSKPDVVARLGQPHEVAAQDGREYFIYNYDHPFDGRAAIIASYRLGASSGLEHAGLFGTAVAPEHVDEFLAEVSRLLEAVRDVLTEALKAGGTSFDALYVNVNGESGYFDRSLNAYGREG